MESRTISPVGNSSFMDKPVRQAFPHLSVDALASLTLLKRAIYIYSFDTQHICWANEAALSFWNSESQAEIYARQLTPYNHATEARLTEYRAAFAEGKARYESWTFYPKGQAVAAMCNLSGVSLDGHAEAMLVEIEAPEHFPLPAIELRALEALRLTTLMISLFSTDGRVLMRNPAATACFARLDADLGTNGDHFRAMFDDPGIAEQVLQDAQSQFVVWQTARIAVKGNPVHRIQVSAVRDPATGQPARLVAQEDISELVHASTQLVASTEALEIVLALDLNPACIIGLDDARILRINSAGESLVGPLSALPATAHRLFADPGICEELLVSLRSNHRVNCEADFLTPDGGRFRALVRGARLIYEQTDAVILSIIDISELYRANALLMEELSSERSMSEVRNRLLAIAAHDLRTPLAIIDSSAQYLSRRADRVAPELIVQRSEQIRAAVRNLLKLFGNTVDRARDHEGLSYSSQCHDIVQIIQEVAHTYCEMLPGFEPELDLDLPEPVQIPLDRLMIEQVLGNLLSNSIKFAAGTPRVRIWIEPDEDSVRIFIRDWGIGIPATERADIFAEYRRGSNVGKVKGSGLGLALVRHAVELHRGSIRLVDAEGPGTTFEITLPRS